MRILTPELDSLKAELEKERARAERYKKRARLLLKKAKYNRGLVDSMFEGEFSCRGQNNRCGRLTNNAMCGECMRGGHPIEVAEKVSAYLNGLLARLHAHCHTYDLYRKQKDLFKEVTRALERYR
jgi:hypothetical protein